MTAYPSLIQISDLLNAGNATRIDGEGAYDLSGVAVAGGGDVNGDSQPDIPIELTQVVTLTAGDFVL